MKNLVKIACVMAGTFLFSMCSSPDYQLLKNEVTMGKK